MVVKEYDNARAYLNEHEDRLLEQEAVAQLFLYNAYQKLDVTKNQKCLFGVIMQAEIPILHFCNVEPQAMVIYMDGKVSDMDNDAAILLADHVISNHITIEGLIGKQGVCQAFISQYKKNANGTFLEKIGVDIMEIREINEINPVEGRHRLAEPEEVKLITEWMINYQLEARTSEINYETALESATKLIEGDKFYIYEDMQQNIVTMAAASRKLVHGIGLNYIYTPEEYRSKGYAAANLYYMSKELLEQGNEFCTLFVDKNNPLTSRAYEKVGYYILEDLYEYQLLLT